MAGSTENIQEQSVVKRVTQAHLDGSLGELDDLFSEDLSPADIAHLFDSLPDKLRKDLWNHLPDELKKDVLAYLSDDLQNDFLAEMSTQEIIETTQDLDSDDVADLLQQLPESDREEVLVGMEPEERAEVEELLAYPEDTAGGLMGAELVTVRADVTLDVVLRFLRRQKELPSHFDSVLVVNRHNKLVGALPLVTLVTKEPEALVRETMDSDIEGIDAMTTALEVANLFQRHDFVSAPVINEEGKLVGRITVDDVVDVIREEADHTVMSMAGLDDDEDTFAPVFRSTRRRAVWLGINLITAFLASAVADGFSLTLDQIVALAVLMNIAPSMGGIAGSQTLTLVIRGMALGHISTGNIRWLLIREITVGALNGVLWAVVIAISTLIWFRDPGIAAIIGAAILINLVIAVACGSSLPLLLKKLNIDPALSGSVILTTITDVVGYLAFLGLATLILL